MLIGKGRTALAMDLMQGACIVAAVVALIAPMAAVDAAVPPPLVQTDAGAVAGEVLCNPGRLLLVSPGGNPACVLGESYAALEGRGWSAAAAEETEVAASATAAAPAPAPPPAYAGHAASAPAIPTVHPTTLAVSKYPVVGQVAEVTLTVTYGANGWHRADYFDTDHPLVDIMIAHGRWDTHRVYDLVSNIGTGDPGVFLPYDPENSTTTARPGETYTVKAKFVIEEEGVANIGARGLDGDYAPIIDIAASANQSMSLADYKATGQTYLDHLLVAAQGQEHYEPPPAVPLPVQDTALNGDTIPESALAAMLGRTYAQVNATEDLIVREMLQLGFLRSDIREFLVHVMNYTDDEAGRVWMGDDLLGRAYWAADYDPADIAHDMIARRNYTADEARGFFVEHMRYADAEAAALLERADVARTQASVAGQQQRQGSVYTVSGTVSGPGYFGGPTMGIHGISVCAYDRGSGGAQDQPLRREGKNACAQTGPSGAYSIQWDHSASTASRTDLLLRVISYGSHGLYVNDSSGASYTHDVRVGTGFARPDSTRDIALSGSIAGAGRIISAISDGRDFFLPDMGKARLLVKWQHDGGASVLARGASDGAVYWRGGNTIWLDGESDETSDDSNHRWVILHEFGHYIMDIAGRFDFVTNCPTPHHLHLKSAVGCAWSEGWADFVPHMIDGEKRLRWTTVQYIDLEQDRTEYSNGKTINNFARTGTSSNEGQLVEGQVAAALWDIKDRNVDVVFDKDGRNSSGVALDDLSMDDDEILATFMAGTYGSFSDFYAAWELAYGATHSARSIMKLHAMDFAEGRTFTPLNETFDGLGNWLAPGRPNWHSQAPPENVGHPSPDHNASTNNVASVGYYRSERTLTLRNGLDLTELNSANMSFWRFLNSHIATSDYLKVEVSPDGGSTWLHAYKWAWGSRHSGGNDGRWHHEVLSLAPYLNSTDFKVRFVSKISASDSHAAVDDVVINATVAGSAAAGTRLLLTPMDHMSAPHGETSVRYVRASDEMGGAASLSIAGKPGFVTFRTAAPGIASVTASPTSAEPLANHTVTITATAAAGGRTASVPFSIGVAPDRITSAAFLSDRFSSSLDGWAYEQRPDLTRNQQRWCSGAADRTAYTLSHSAQNGGSAYMSPAASGCWYGSAGASKSFAIPDSARDGLLKASVTARSLATWYNYNNLRFTVTDSSGNVMTTGTVFQGTSSNRLVDSGLVTWRSGTFWLDASCPCKIFVHAQDRLSSQYQKFYLGEVHVAPFEGSSCGMTLAKSKLDFGGTDASAKLSGTYAQTVQSTGFDPLTSVKLEYTDWTLPSGARYPAGITEIRAPLAGIWNWVPLSRTIQLGPINPGGELDVEFRINYGSHAVVDPAGMKQSVWYVGRCDSSLPPQSARSAADPEGAPPAEATTTSFPHDSLVAKTVLSAGTAPPPPDVPPADNGTAPPPPVHAMHSLAAGRPAVPNTLKADELFAMLLPNASRVVIAEKLVYERDIVVGWEDHPTGGPYKAVIHRDGGAPGSGSSGARMADASVMGLEYRFTGLEPSADYVVRVGVRGDDSTQSTVRATTLAPGGAALPSGLNLTARIVPSPASIALDWTDSNGVDGGRYGVVVSIGGEPFGPAGIGPGSDTSAGQAVRPDWLNKTVAYKVFERIGPQKLYSNEASVELPAALEAPRNLRAHAVRGEGGEGGPGATILVEWDHAPLSRHYILEARGADGEWERLSRTDANSYEHVPDGPPGQVEYRVTTQLHSALSPPSGPLVYNAAPPGIIRGE